jgi:hypothetical protein
MKKITFAIIGLLLIALTVGSAFAQEDCVDCCYGGPCFGDDAQTPTLDVTECLVRINDRIVRNDVMVLKAFERGQDLEIKVEFVSSQMAQDVQIMAFLTGYHRGSRLREQIFDITPTFNVQPSVSYERVLRLRLPDDFRVLDGDELKVRLVIADRFATSYVREYNLLVEAQPHNLIIQDIILDPAGQVQAGRGLFVRARVRNMGQYTEESLRITASIPGLNIMATEYIDELDREQAITSEDMF